MAAPRDTTRSREQFEAAVERSIDTRERSAARLHRAVTSGRTAFGSMAPLVLTRAVGELDARYAAGDPIDEIAPHVRAMGEVWVETSEAPGPLVEDLAWQQTVGTLASSLDLHRATVCALSWAVLVGEHDVAHRVLGTSLLRGSTDPVIGRLARFAGQPGDDSGAALHPKQWQGWLDVARAEPDARPAALERYVRGYAKSWRRTTVLTAPTDPMYGGTWAVDAAALAVGLDIDDTTCRGIPEYPTELADHGSSQAQRSR